MTTTTTSKRVVSGQRNPRAPEDVALHGTVSQEVYAWMKARAARNRHSLSREVWGLLQEVFEREQLLAQLPTSMVHVPGGFHTDATTSDATSVPR